MAADLVYAYVRPLVLFSHDLKKSVFSSANAVDVAYSEWSPFSECNVSVELFEDSQAIL